MCVVPPMPKPSTAHRTGGATARGRDTRALGRQRRVHRAPVINGERALFTVEGEKRTPGVRRPAQTRTESVDPDTVIALGGVSPDAVTDGKW